MRNELTESALSFKVQHGTVLLPQSWHLAGTVCQIEQYNTFTDFTNAHKSAHNDLTIWPTTDEAIVNNSDDLTPKILQISYWVTCWLSHRLGWSIRAGCGSDESQTHQSSAHGKPQNRQLATSIVPNHQVVRHEPYSKFLAVHIFATAHVMVRTQTEKQLISGVFLSVKEWLNFSLQVCLLNLSLIEFSESVMQLWLYCGVNVLIYTWNT